MLIYKYIIHNSILKCLSLEIFHILYTMDRTGGFFSHKHDILALNINCQAIIINYSVLMLVCKVFFLYHPSRVNSVPVNFNQSPWISRVGYKSIQTVFWLCNVQLI